MFVMLLQEKTIRNLLHKCKEKVVPNRQSPRFNYIKICICTTISLILYNTVPIYLHFHTKFIKKFLEVTS